MRLMKILHLFLICCFFATSLGAEVKKFEKLLDYTGVTVRKIEKDGIRIIHSGGVARIPIEKIPEKIRQELGMSMDGIGDFREKEAAAKELAMRKAKIKAANKRVLDSRHIRLISSTVFQVVDGGVLLRLGMKTDGTYRQIPQYETKTSQTGTRLTKRQTTKRRVVTGYKKVLNTQSDGRLVFLKCDNQNFIDGSGFSGDIWRNGRFSYTNSFGSGKTIPKFTTNPKDIIGP